MNIYFRFGLGIARTWKTAVMMLHFHHVTVPVLQSPWCVEIPHRKSKHSAQVHQTLERVTYLKEIAIAMYEC